MLIRQLNTLFETPLRKGVPKTVEIDVLAEWLSKPVHELLQHDSQRLVSLLYRIDVNEQKLNAAFQQDSTEAIAFAIARLVIERELQKVQLRLKYSPNRN